MGKVWAALVAFCIIYGLLHGRAEAMLAGLLEVPNRTLGTLLQIGGLIVFYNGLLEIAVKSGLVEKLAKRSAFLIGKIFPKLPEKSPAREHIAVALVANLLGLGAAGTPSAIKALKALKEGSEGLTSEMLKFLLLNVACFTVFPATVLSIRKAFFAEMNLVLLPFFVLGSFLLSLLALLFSHGGGHDR